MAETGEVLSQLLFNLSHCGTVKITEVLSKKCVCESRSCGTLDVSVQIALIRPAEVSNWQNGGSALSPGLRA